MRLILLCLFSILVSETCSCQEGTVSFSDAIKPHLNKYNLQSDLEYERGDVVKAQFLFDSLVAHYLVGSRINDYALKNVNGGKVRLGKIKKPILVITYASWCVLNKGEVPALNKLSKKYSKDVQIIVLFWDKKANVRKVSRKFSGGIKVCYANESYRNDAGIVSTLKHTLGFPTSYYLNSNLNVVDIKRGGIATDGKINYVSAYNLNYSLFNERLKNFLVKKDEVKSQLIVDTE